MYDMANAFPSLSAQSVVKAWDSVGPAHRRQLIVRHVTEAKCLLDTPSGVLPFSLGSRVLLGSSVGPRLFNMDFAQTVIAPWIESCSTRDPSLVAANIANSCP